jgi:hypothetical protein
LLGSRDLSKQGCVMRHFRNARQEGGASHSESDRRLRYGGPWFSTASALPLEGYLTRLRPLARFVAAAVRRPRRLVALIVLLLRTRREYVVLSRSCAGKALDVYFNERSLGIVPRNRLCRGVLLLPQDHPDYLRGRHRRALRTNLRRAAAAGIRCEVVSDKSQARDDACHVFRRYWDSLTDTEFEVWMKGVHEAIARPETTVAVARDQHGRPLAFSATVVDDTVCLLDIAVATCHEARWALHDHLVQILIARRVRYLLAEGGGPFGALGYPNNLQHYQHLLGYQLRHLIPANARPATRRRRVLASLAVLAAATAIIAPRAVANSTHSTTPGVTRSPGTASRSCGAQVPAAPEVVRLLNGK